MRLVGVGGLGVVGVDSGVDVRFEMGPAHTRAEGWPVPLEAAREKPMPAMRLSASRASPMCQAPPCARGEVADAHHGLAGVGVEQVAPATDLAAVLVALALQGLEGLVALGAAAVDAVPLDGSA